MPIYDFKCEKCEHVHEKRCSYDKAKAGLTGECPKCGGNMFITPCNCGGFKVYGFSADNGYTCDNMSYDGNPNPKW